MRLSRQLAATLVSLAATTTALVTTAPPRLLRNVQDTVDHASQRFSDSAVTTTTPGEVLECFQVQNPVLCPDGAVTGSQFVDLAHDSGAESCDVLLMDYHFGNSYGHPFVGKYTPPSCPFTRVVMNFTVVSEGTQFDRIALMYLGDTEVWRTSTAEPTAPPGIAWTYIKEMTTYLNLWKQPQTVIFDLGNLINDMYTGVFNATIQLTFINDDLAVPGAKPADQIVALSARKSSQGMPSAFTYPQDTPSVAATLPQNVQRAIISVSATGQADEEFWWSNVPNSVVNVFGHNVSLAGQGSFREVQLYIDGQLAGLSWPFPVIFTGGVSPPLHRPIVGLQAFDLLEKEIDITPWLGVLSDGEQHTFSFKIVDAYNQVVPAHWILSGKIFLWLSDDDSIKTHGAPPSVHVNYQLDGRGMSQPIALGGGAYRYTQNVHRAFQATSHLVRNGKPVQSTWSQLFDMQNNGVVGNLGNYQEVDGEYDGEDVAIADLHQQFGTVYSYPVNLVLNVTGPTPAYKLDIAAQLYQGLDFTVIGDTVFSTGLEPFAHKLSGPLFGSTTSTFRQGTADFYQYNGGKSNGTGETRQVFRFGGASELPSQGAYNPAPLLYSRDVTAQNEVITHDQTYAYQSQNPTPQFSKVVMPADSLHKTGEFAPLPARQRGGAKVLRKDILDQLKRRT